MICPGPTMHMAREKRRYARQHYPGPCRGLSSIYAMDGRVLSSSAHEGEWKCQRAFLRPSSVQQEKTAPGKDAREGRIGCSNTEKYDSCFADMLRFEASRVAESPVYFLWEEVSWEEFKQHRPLRESGNVRGPSFGLLQCNRRGQLKVGMYVRGGSAVAIQRNKIHVSPTCSCFGPSRVAELPPFIFLEDIS